MNSIKGKKGTSKNFQQKVFAFIKKVVYVMINHLPGWMKYRMFEHRFFAFLFFKPGRSQRVYLKRGLDPVQFLEQLNQKGIEYVLLRWWEDLPSYPDGEDINILVKDEHRDLINDLVSLTDNRGRKCDIYTVSGAKNGDRFGVPVFPYNLTHALLSSKYLFNGAYVPAPVPYFASVAYHAILHKGRSSGLPGFAKERSKSAYDYTGVLTKMSRELGIEVDISVTSLYQWLKQEGLAPEEDTLTKLIEKKPELAMLGKRLYSDIRGGDLLVYVIRERLLQEGELNAFTDFLENKYSFDILDIHLLSPEEKDRCSKQVRGGKWDKGPYPASGGLPIAFVVAFDYHPEPLRKSEQKKQTRMTNRNSLLAKYKFREYLAERSTSKKVYNGVHSADNELDAWSYIAHLGTEYQKKIAAEVEVRRERFATKWGVEKVLSAGPVSKVEVIKYKNGLGVKKTFRPGKEVFFERELFAVKELSRKFSFIPPLLESGDGFVIMPYLENKLNALSEEEKREVIASKEKEIFALLADLHSEGMMFHHFTPESLIITPEEKLYCTGFSFLQKASPDSSEPKDNPILHDEKGNKTNQIQQKLFSEVWGDYLSTKVS